MFFEVHIIIHIHIHIFLTIVKKIFFTVDITFSTDVSDNDTGITEHVTHLIEEGTVIYFI